MSSVDLLLVGKAADWAESSPEISIIFASYYTSELLTRFLLLFKKRFFIKSLEIVTTNFLEELDNLR